MLAYLFSIILTLVFLRVALSRNKKKYWILPIVPSILLLTFRGVNVGTDTTHYTDLFETAQGYYSYIGFLLSYRLEYGFGTLLYFAAQIGLSANFAFFLYALFTICPIFVAIFLLRHRVSPYLMTTLYLLMFYQYSFNIVRQSIAMSFIVLSIALLLTEKNRPAIICSFVSLLFHNVAILIIPIVLLYVINGKQRIKWLLVIISLLSVCLYFGGDYILSSMDYYTDAYLLGNKVSAQSSYLVEMGLNLLLIFMAWTKTNNKEIGYGLFIISFVFLLIMASTYFSYAFRIANCYDILIIIFIPLSIRVLNSKMIRIGYISFAIFYWWFVFIYNNSGGTYPFYFA